MLQHNSAMVLCANPSAALCTAASSCALQKQCHPVALMNALNAALLLLVRCVLSWPRCSSQEWVVSHRCCWPTGLPSHRGSQPSTAGQHILQGGHSTSAPAASWRRCCTRSSACPPLRLQVRRGVPHVITDNTGPVTRVKGSCTWCISTDGTAECSGLAGCSSDMSMTSSSHNFLLMKF